MSKTTKVYELIPLTTFKKLQRLGTKSLQYLKHPEEHQ